jgi:hypothetical protein
MRALLATEEVTIDFTDDGIAALARIAAEVNDALENIGARRLQTVMEKLVEDISFTAEPQGRDAGDRQGIRRPAAGRHRQKRRLSRYVLDRPAGVRTSPWTNGDHSGADSTARRLAAHWLQVCTTVALPVPREGVARSVAGMSMQIGCVGSSSIPRGSLPQPAILLGRQPNSARGMAGSQPIRHAHVLRRLSDGRGLETSRPRWASQDRPAARRRQTRSTRRRPGVAMSDLGTKGASRTHGTCWEDQVGVSAVIGKVNSDALIRFMPLRIHRDQRADQGAATYSSGWRGSPAQCR